MSKWLILVILSCITACASVTEKNRSKAELHLRLGVSLLQGQEYPAALTELLKAEKLDPQNAVVQNNLGLVYFFRERYDLAGNHLKKAISILPSFSDARNNLARVYIEQARYKEAEVEITRVLNDLTYPSPEKALINMGLVKFNTKQYQDAQNQFLKAIKAAPDDCIAHTYLGRSLFEQTQYSRAAEALDRAISFCQKNLYDEPHYYSALAHYRSGDKNKSITRFEEIVKYYPNGKYREKSQDMLKLLRKGHL